MEEKEKENAEKGDGSMGVNGTMEGTPPPRLQGAPAAAPGSTTPPPRRP
jgi:hypothetical protein